MATNTNTLTCPACDEPTDKLTYRKWTHYDHGHGWAYEDGERVSGEYCDDCLADIDRIRKAHEEYLMQEDEEPTIEDWAFLASKVCMALSQHFSNWKDVARPTEKELRMLTERMGENWQRKW